MITRLALMVVIARVLTTEEFGAYSVVLNVIGLVGVVALGGWPSYFMAVIPKEGVSTKRLREAYAGTAKLTLVGSVAQIGLLVLLLGGTDHLWLVVLASLILLTFMTTGTLMNEGHRAAGGVVASRWSFALVFPLVAIVILFVFAAVGVEIGVVTVLAATSAGWALLWLLSEWALRRRVTHRTPSKVPMEFNRRDLFLVKIAQAVLSASDVLLVSYFASLEDAAMYAVARRITIVAGLGLTTVVMLYGPQLSAAAQDGTKLRTLARRTTMLSFWVSVPIVGALAILGPYILAMFGSEYRSAYSILIVLLIGSSANALAGPIGTIVNVNGQEAMSRNVMLASAGVLLFVSLVLGSAWGAVGIAWSWSLVTVAWNFALWRRVDYGEGGSRSVA